MANSRIMLVCKHCGGEMVLGKGYFGSYSAYGNKTDALNAFFEEHEQGCCSDETDCSDNARNHFVILEEGETLEDLPDVAPKSEVAREIFEDLQDLLIMRVGINQAIAELKKKYTGGKTDENT